MSLEKTANDAYVTGLTDALRNMNIEPQVKIAAYKTAMNLPFLPEEEEEEGMVVLPAVAGAGIAGLGAKGLYNHRTADASVAYGDRAYKGMTDAIREAAKGADPLERMRFQEAAAKVEQLRAAQKADPNMLKAIRRGGLTLGGLGLLGGGYLLNKAYDNA